MQTNVSMKKEKNDINVSISNMVLSSALKINSPCYLFYMLIYLMCSMLKPFFPML
jgi:hypothetical protein